MQCPYRQIRHDKFIGLSLPKESHETVWSAAESQMCRLVMHIKWRNTDFNNEIFVL
jgi:hypothetical protein